MVFQPLRMQRQQRAVVRPGDQLWQNAPQAPIERWPLEREAPEHGQVTSMVRYLPGAQFPPHPHPLGEEILVLEGTFSDDSGDFPQGSYLRNPPGSSHAPFSAGGCLIFVKLNQFDPNDSELVRSHIDERHGSHCLHAYGAEQTWYLALAAGERLPATAKRAEMVVLSGTLQDADGLYPPHSWLRLPAADVTRLRCQSQCRLWVRFSA
ncbi:cupin [Bacterioplanes sanyensis]|uniref:cupin domain-containing protein n=1 Tax=Bacterioplanes sanyensis TaxID=1249553 RepID=UPI0019B55615|nr:cupin domain-containing protein [Bacterioplanes sanyensis]GGY49926.1 cupin [Bacterioplanes sanyensis]